VRAAIRDGQKSIAEIKDRNFKGAEPDRAPLAQRDVLAARSADPFFNFAHREILSIGSI
jgi:hypothetical protein